MADDLDAFFEDAPQKMKPASGRDASVFRKPMSATFLATAMGMGPRTVQKKLAECPPIGHSRNAPLYDFAQAMPYLVKPKAADIREALKQIGESDLPMSLQKDVWDARIKEQTWRSRAGELWKTEDVLEVLGDAFQALSSTTKLWTDQIADKHDLPIEVRETLMKRVDVLNEMLHRRLVEMPKEKQTLSQESEHPEE
ncbi:MAG: hypothetical protein ACK5Q5_10065 [Planctomycetaceae bacterium]